LQFPAIPVKLLNCPLRRDFFQIHFIVRGRFMSRTRGGKSSARRNSKHRPIYRPVLGRIEDRVLPGKTLCLFLFSGNLLSHLSPVTADSREQQGSSRMARASLTSSATGSLVRTAAGNNLDDGHITPALIGQNTREIQNQAGDLLFAGQAFDS